MIDTDAFDPGHPHPHLDDTIDIEWVDKDAGVAGVLRVAVRPASGATWFLAVVHERGALPVVVLDYRSEEHTSELQSRTQIAYAVFCLKKKLQKLTDMNEVMYFTYYRDNPC